MGNNKVKHIIRMKFNVPYDQFKNPFVEERLTKEWMKYRLDIFMKYTYPSLIQQTSNNFTAFIYYDEKSEAILKKLLAAYPPLQPHIIFTKDMPKAVEEIIKGYDKVIFTLWDSDNLFYPQLIERIQEVDVANYQCVVVPSGYIYELATKRMGTYYYPYPDTFYSLVYDVKSYLSGYRYPYETNQYEDFLSGYACQKLKYYTLEGNNFIVLVHGHNISHVLDKMVLTGVVKNISTNQESNEKILKAYGVES